MGGDGGVFLGIERPDWALAQPPSARGSVYAVTGDNVSAAAGRVSFVLGLQGPCSSVDTACSSALSALHGRRTQQRWRERQALALAVSLKLVPHGTLGAASAGMLSSDGRCKTLDARANGYVRSEGVGALVVRRHGAAMARLLGWRQRGASGWAVGEPDGAQRLGAAHAAAGRGARPRGGRERGRWDASRRTARDGAGRPDRGGRAGGGACSLARSARQPLAWARSRRAWATARRRRGRWAAARPEVLHARQVMGNAQLRVLNPLVGERWGGVLASFVLHGAMAVPSGLGRGVSSFGYSGTIAHAVLAFNIANAQRLTCRIVQRPRPPASRLPLV